MPDLEPITREEMLLDGQDLEPITRKEMFIKRIYDKTQVIPEPITREEMFLKKAGDETTDVTIEQLNVSENGTYSEEGVAYSPVIVNVPAPPIPDNAYLLNEVEGLPSDIATFSDGSNLPLASLKVGIEPIQSGSGDPSPTNIRPISGWSAVDVTRCGKNLLDKASGKIAEGNSRFIAFGVDSFSDTKPNGSIKLESGTYTFSTSGPLSTNLEAIAVLNSSNERIGIAYNKTELTFTVTATGFFKISISVTVENFTNWDNYNLQLEKNSEPTTYEPYNGQTITIQFKDGDNPLTVYGGSLDVVSGVLTVDRAIRLVSDCTWQGSNGGFYTNSVASTVKHKDGRFDHVISNVYKAENVGSITPLSNGGISVDADGYIQLKDSRYSTASDFKTNTGTTQLVYELATPTTIQLTPTQVNSLIGVNNIWADCGQILEGEYWSKEV